MASGGRPSKVSTTAWKRGADLGSYRRALYVFFAVLAIGGFFVITGPAAPSFLLGVFVIDSFLFLAFLMYRAGVLAKAERTRGQILWGSKGFWMLNPVWVLLIGLVAGVIGLVSFVQALEAALWISVCPLLGLIVAYVERIQMNKRSGSRPRSPLS